MSKSIHESASRWYDYGLHLESRTVYLGDGDDGVDAEMAEKAVKAFTLLAATPDKPIKLIINSFGGCWFNGMAIYDTVKFCPCHVTAYVVGSAMSMGSVILQAADERIVYPNATVMVHDGYETRVDDTPKTFVNWAEFSKRTCKTMYGIYAERSGKPVAYWRKKCEADTILSAKEAVEVGLADRVFTPA